MSVLIRGMKMPSECRVCPMIAYGVLSGSTWCSINKAVLAMDFKTIQFEGRHKDCPLVDLGSHGDLKEFIDVTTTVNEDDGTQEVNLGEAFSAYFKMREAPTIIEAEGAEL